MKFTRYFYFPFQGVIGEEELRHENKENNIKDHETFDYQGADDNKIHLRLLAVMTKEIKHKKAKNRFDVNLILTDADKNQIKMKEQERL
jgi:hypothetical protein